MMYHTGYTTLLHPLDNQHRLDFLFDLPAVFLLGQEKWSEPQPLVGRQVANLWNQYFEAKCFLWNLRAMDLFEANAEGEEKSLFEKHHQHMV